MRYRRYMTMLFAAALALEGSFAAYAQTVMAENPVNAGGISVPGGPGTETGAEESAAAAGSTDAPSVTVTAGSTGAASGVVTAGQSMTGSSGPSASGSGNSRTVTAGGGAASAAGPGVAGSDTASGASVNAWEKVNGVYVDSEGRNMDGALFRGISVSKWQGDIDWSLVAADDVSFAFIRMGSFGYEGEYTMDEYYEKNMNGAIAAGIHAAPYVFLQTKTVEEAREAARFAVEKAKGYTVSYPFAVDIESQYILDLSVQELTDVVNAFCQEIAAAGYTPIVYSDYNKFSTEMDTNQIPYDLWLARYGGDGQYPNRTIWQSTDEGQVNGVSGNVCLEFSYRDYASGQTGPSRVISAGG